MKMDRLIVMLLAPGMMGANIFKCADGNQVIYSDRVCGEVVERLGIIPSATPDSFPSDQYSELLRSADERADRDAFRRKMREAARANSVIVGMDASWVIAAWGKPDRVNNGINVSGSWEQWVYERSRKQTQYVHFMNGKVVSAE